MELVELFRVAKIVSGSTPSRKKPEFFKGDINWFTPKNLGKLKIKTIDEAPEKITIEGYNSCSTTIIPPYSVLFTCRAPIGHIAINTIECCTNQGFKSVVPMNDLLDVNYLYYCLKMNVPKIKNLGRGATFKELSKRDLEKFKIPLPPLPTQKKIAAILDEADTLRQLNKNLITKYDALTQSLFLDMFGDPFNGDNMEQLKKNIYLTGGYAFKSKDFVKFGVPLIKIGTVNKGYFDTNNCSFLPESYLAKYNKWIIEPNDILMSLTGTVGKDDYGNVELANNEYESYFLNQRVAKIEPSNNKYLKEFIYGMFSHSKTKRTLTKISRGVRQANISNKDIENLKMIVPNLEMQSKYIESILLIRKQKAQAQQSLQKSEDLFNSLLQKAFKGELVK